MTLKESSLSFFFNMLFCSWGFFLLFLRSNRGRTSQDEKGLIEGYDSQTEYGSDLPGLEEDLRIWISANSWLVLILLFHT